MGSIAASARRVVVFALPAVLAVGLAVPLTVIFARNRAPGASGPAQQPPVLPLSAFEQNAGETCQGVPVTQTFTFRNGGQTALRVAAVDTSCTCAVYELSAYEINPGDTGSVVLTAHTDTPVSYESKTRVEAQVSFVGYAQPLRLGLTMTVVRAFPLVVDFGRLPPAAPVRSQSFRVRACDGAHAIRALRAEDPAVVARPAEMTADGLPRALEIEFHAPDQPGLFVTAVWVEFEDTTCAPVSIAVRATIAPRIEARPESLALGTVRPGRRYVYALTLASTVAEAFEIEGTKTGIPGLECRYSRVAAGATTYSVQATLTAPDVSGSITGSVEITTSDPACPRVVVPVKGVCVSDDPPGRASEEAGTP